MRALLMLVLALPALAAADEWTGSDKTLHFASSAIIGFATGRTWPDDKLKAWGVAMIPGTLKELSDISTTGFSGKDMVVNALGAALGVHGGAWSVRQFGATTQVVYQVEF